MKLHGLKNAWLAPDGKLLDDHEKMDYSIPSFHLELGNCIVADINKVEKVDLYDYTKFGHNFSAINYLQNLGWIRLHGFGGIKPVWIISHRKNRLTRMQEHIIEKWCIENNRHFLNCFNQPYKWA